MVGNDIFIQERAFGFGGFELGRVFCGYVVIAVGSAAVEGDFERLGFGVVVERQDGGSFFGLNRLFGEAGDQRSYSCFLRIRYILR